MICKGIKRLAAAFLSGIIAVNGITASAVGDIGLPGKDSCSVSVPFTVADKKGWIPEGTMFTVEMKAENGAPLPEKTSYEVDVSGEHEFGPIEFDEPDDYEYTVSELVYDDGNIVFDETVYHVHVAVFYDDDGELVGVFSLTKDGADVKPERVEFYNDYLLPPEDSTSDSDSSKPGSSGSSGDGKGGSSGDGGRIFNPHTGAVISIGAFGLAVPMLVLFAVNRRRRQDDSEPPEEETG